MEVLLLLLRFGFGLAQRRKDAKERAAHGDGNAFCRDLCLGRWRLFGVSRDGSRFAPDFFEAG